MMSEEGVDRIAQAHVNAIVKIEEDEKELDRQAMRNLSNLLAKAKFEIYRMH